MAPTDLLGLIELTLVELAETALVIKEQVLNDPDASVRNARGLTTSTAT